MVEHEMAKGRKKQALKRSRRSAAKQTPNKKTLGRKTVKKGTARAIPNASQHHAVFRALTARSNQHNKAPVCYQQLADGSWMICFLQSDGTYAQCQAYTGPIHQPPCG
jgi:hypothetical protein